MYFKYIKMNYDYVVWNEQRIVMEKFLLVRDESKFLSSTFEINPCLLSYFNIESSFQAVLKKTTIIPDCQ